MGKIFISYRRDDSEYIVGRIYEDLCTAYGEKNIFMDVDSIPLGVDFRDEISEVVNSCEMLIALIGEKWNTITDASGNPRINDPDDFVRIEIEEALKRNIPVIPIITSKAELPKENQLPDSLKELAYRNAIRIRPDPDYKIDIIRLKNNIDKIHKKHVKLSPYLLIILGIIAILGTLFIISIYGEITKETYDNITDNHNNDSLTSTFMLDTLNSAELQHRLDNINRKIRDAINRINQIQFLPILDGATKDVREKDEQEREQDIEYQQKLIIELQRDSIYIQDEIKRRDPSNRT